MAEDTAPLTTEDSARMTTEEVADLLGITVHAVCMAVFRSPVRRAASTSPLTKSP
jgi:hypothetical protein